MSHFFFTANISNAALDATNILWKVNFVLDTILYLRLKADTILTSLSTLKKALKFLLDPQTDFESFNGKRNFFQSIVWICRSKPKINLEMKPKNWKVNFCWKALVTEFPVSVFLFTIFQTFYSLLSLANQFFSQNDARRAQKPAFARKQRPHILHILRFSQQYSQFVAFLFWCQSRIFSEMKVEALKSELLLKDSGHNICCFCSSLNIFSNQFNP